MTPCNGSRIIVSLFECPLGIRSGEFCSHVKDYSVTQNAEKKESLLLAAYQFKDKVTDRTGCKGGINTTGNQPHIAVCLGPA